MLNKNDMTTRYHHQKLTSQTIQPSISLFNGIENEYMVSHVYEIADASNLDLPLYKF
jgi:hypothetical protein